MNPSFLCAPRFAALSPLFYRPVAPEPLPAPRCVIANDALAAALGLTPDALRSSAMLDTLSGNAAPAHGLPLASRYGGHQFGVWAGQLGDGRALLLGDAVDSAARRHEVQLKGAGRTPFSRMGDGRAVLRSSIREYLASEAMHALGIPTTRALLLVASPAMVWRERAEPAAVVTRVAESFLRFGHFELLYHGGEQAALRELADYALRQHFLDCLHAPEPVLAMFAEVVARTARLMAAWQAVGFCHGVMNSDNMSLLGLTLDYGPFGFMDATDLDHVCNHSDSRGRYAYRQQPQVALWNLYCLASSLLPLLNEAALRSVLNGYPAQYQAAWLARFRAKLGLERGEAADEVLINDLLALMHEHGADFTLTFRRLCAFSPQDAASSDALRALFADPTALSPWLERYAGRLAGETRDCAARQAAMRAVNPWIVLRNHLAESAIRAAEGGDDSEVQRLALALAEPYVEQPAWRAYGELPPAWAADLCLSCSS